MVAVVMKQEERCQVVVCRHEQDENSGKKFVLKPGESVRLGSGRGNEVMLDYEGVSKHHAEISLREKLPEEVILGSDVKLPTMLSIRDLTSRNGIGIRKMPFDPENMPTLGSFERLQSATSQVLQDGCCILIPAKSRRYDKQMTVEQRLITFHVSTVLVDVPVPVPPPVPTPRPVERRLPPAVAPVAPVRAVPPPRAISPPPRQYTPPPRQFAAPVVPPMEDVAKAKPKKKKPKTSKTMEEERLSFARPVRTEGLATLTGEAWPPVLPREEVEGYDVPRRADKVEVSSDEETAPALTQANVARASAAAAMAAGVEPPEVDPELRSISPISTPGVFPWQAEKKTSKKKRAESPQSTDVHHKKRKGDTGKSKSKKLTLTAAHSGMQWDPYMQREASPSPCSQVPGANLRGKEGKKKVEKKKRKDKDGSRK
eukprot:CAMPEP_0114668072 /NCGR_PEP_ID=MMETSP0191-20121206/35663_1 /TAXON_ID=126664 /ORGANISM="Sorites sp." /LENGTH=427 /DNA_ID=CAMNT_0001920291 /DNA_START=66 /DNA_END=1346 /DNA_ORIENTATION=+